MFSFANYNDNLVGRLQNKLGAMLIIVGEIASRKGREFFVQVHVVEASLVFAKAVLTQVGHSPANGGGQVANEDLCYGSECGKQCGVIEEGASEHTAHCCSQQSNVVLVCTIICNLWVVTLLTLHT